MITKALSIAGFDSSGGAGLQADLKTFSALGSYGMTVLTALPIQNTRGVTNCYDIPLKAIHEQLEAIFNDIPPDAIKIGMLSNQEIVELVTNFLTTHAPSTPIVLDPVMVAKSGDYLLLPEAIETLKTKLIKHVTIITPNIHEAEALTNISINSNDDMLRAGEAILKLGAQGVLVKGGHINGDHCRDLLLTNHECHWFESPRIDTQNTHGTGCTLSAAIAVGLANALTLEQSCAQAKDYITNALLSFKDEKIGYGHGPVNHFYKTWTTK